MPQIVAWTLSSNIYSFMLALLCFISATPYSTRFLLSTPQFRREDKNFSVSFALVFVAKFCQISSFFYSFFTAKSLQRLKFRYKIAHGKVQWLTKWRDWIDLGQLLSTKLFDFLRMFSQHELIFAEINFHHWHFQTFWENKFSERRRAFDQRFDSCWKIERLH